MKIFRPGFGKKGWIITDVILTALVILLAVAGYMVKDTVFVKYVTLDGTHTYKVRTRAKTAGVVYKDLGEQQPGKTVTAQDIVKPSRNTTVKNGDTVEVRKIVKTSAVIGGKRRSFTKYPGTVKENLKLNRIKYSQQDIITPTLSEKVRSKTKIEVKRVKFIVTKEESSLEPETDTLFDKRLDSGTIRTTEGEKGKALYKIKTAYINGEKSYSDREKIRTTKKAVNKKVFFGTKATGETGEFKVRKTFTGNCTAYYSGTNPLGACGTPCHYGTCAVDPTFVPYGTRLYITGYGYAVANDCGGAVKKNVVDLYMNSTAACFQWGRRFVKVYVID